MFTTLTTLAAGAALFNIVHQDEEALRVQLGRGKYEHTIPLLPWVIEGAVINSLESGPHLQLPFAHSIRKIKTHRRFSTISYEMDTDPEVAEDRQHQVIGVASWQVARKKDANGHRIPYEDEYDIFHSDMMWKAIFAVGEENLATEVDTTVSEQLREVIDEVHEENPELSLRRLKTHHVAEQLKERCTPRLIRECGVQYLGFKLLQTPHTHTDAMRQIAQAQRELAAAQVDIAGSMGRMAVAVGRRIPPPKVRSGEADDDNLFEAQQLAVEAATAVEAGNAAVLPFIPDIPDASPAA